MKPELSGRLQLELEALESHFVSALGTELRSSERAVALITVDLSLEPHTFVFNIHFSHPVLYRVVV